MKTPDSALPRTTPWVRFLTFCQEHPKPLLSAAGLLLLVLVLGLWGKFIGAMIGSLLGGVLALAIVAGLFYKLFTGFPSIFGPVLQLFGGGMVCACGFSLYLRYSAGGAAKIDALATELRTQGVPEILLQPISNASSACIGIFIGLLVGLAAEMVCGLVRLGQEASEIKDKLKG